MSHVQKRQPTIPKPLVTGNFAAQTRISSTTKASAHETFAHLEASKLLTKILRTHDGPVAAGNPYPGFCGCLTTTSLSPFCKGSCAANGSSCDGCLVHENGPNKRVTRDKQETNKRRVRGWKATCCRSWVKSELSFFKFSFPVLHVFAASF